ncbi:[3-methyl-2-oxobutanoate dehydrogenase [lipoamide]] kinase [Chlorella vulgaris]
MSRSLLPAAASLYRGRIPEEPVIRQLVNLRGWVPGGGGSSGSSQRRSVWGEAAAKDEIADRESFYDNVVETWAAKPVRKLTLQKLLNFGRDAWFDQSRVLDSARFAQQELPKRLARRLMDLQLLPYIVVHNPNIKKVYNAYYHGFATLKDLGPIADMQQNDHFVKLLRRLVDEHSPMLDALAQGMREVRSKPIVGEQLQLDGFLENMLRSRISRRVMAEQHINLTHQRPGYIGIVCTHLNLADAVDFAATRCKQAFVEHYGVAPDVFVSGDTSLTIPYIPAHLDYMLYELLKNSSRAVVEYHLGLSRTSLVDPLAAHRRSQLPPIHVRLCGGEQDVTIRLSDQGGGIDDSDMSAVWQFGWSTTTRRQRPKPAYGLAQPLNGQRGGGPPVRRASSEEAAILGVGEGLGLDTAPPGVSFGAAVGALESGMGLGFGLPLSRLYARYFGGDLRLVNMPGYGVDSFLTLKRLEDAEWEESRAELQTGMLHTGVVHGA